VFFSVSVLRIVRKINLEFISLACCGVVMGAVYRITEKMSVNRSVN